MRKRSFLFGGAIHLHVTSKVTVEIADGVTDEEAQAALDACREAVASDLVWDDDDDRVSLPGPVEDMTVNAPDDGEADEPATLLVLRRMGGEVVVAPLAVARTARARRRPAAK